MKDNLKSASQLSFLLIFYKNTLSYHKTNYQNGIFVIFPVFLAEVIDKIQKELDILRNNLNLNFDEHVLHELLVFPTNSLCLSTKISKEDCLVLVSCMHPKEDEKLEHCILLSRDNQYYKSYQDNIFTS